ncbi:hypothetical protein [Streptomyces huiliensis]|uniref:hypothetical protein n=1 Tax=Streptomyces huiliensis TaxID=2876027 RepID=UPI001CBF7F9C|nr:hypothetical protein [Streptomyces huiliensis]MBZ4319871.1 hypothetical protein [Streptomyces huiliensis]
MPGKQWGDPQPSPESRRSASDRERRRRLLDTASGFVSSVEPFPCVIYVHAPTAAELAPARQECQDCAYALGWHVIDVIAWAGKRCGSAERRHLDRALGHFSGRGAAALLTLHRAMLPRSEERYRAIVAAIAAHGGFVHFRKPATGATAAERGKG